MEIERKWLLRSLPKILEGETPDVQGFQAYLPLIGYKGEARIRESTNPRPGEVKWQLTFKSLGSLSRQEWEMPIPQWLFDSLCEIAKKQIRKNISFISYAQHRLEFHVYTDRFLRDLLIMECEFKNEHEANSFVPPDWLDIIKEVTTDLRYRNSNLAANGPPKE